MGGLVLIQEVKDDDIVYSVRNLKQGDFAGVTIIADASLLLHHIMHRHEVAADVLNDDFTSLNTVLAIYIREAQNNGITLKFVFDGLDQPGKADCQAAQQKIQQEKQYKLSQHL